MPKLFDEVEGSLKAAHDVITAGDVEGQRAYYLTQALCYALAEIRQELWKLGPGKEAK